MSAPDNVFLDTKIGEYGHGARITPLRDGECDQCRRSGIAVLHIDTSQGEYATLSICRDCLNKHFGA